MSRGVAIDDLEIPFNPYHSDCMKYFLALHSSRGLIQGCTADQGRETSSSLESRAVIVIKQWRLGAASTVFMLSILTW